MLLYVRWAAPEERIWRLVQRQCVTAWPARGHALWSSAGFEADKNKGVFGSPVQLRKSHLNQVSRVC
jgi:hypothetical protein